MAELIDKLSVEITHKEHPNICFVGMNYSPYLSFIRKSNIKLNCSKADIIFTSRNLQLDEPQIVFNYELLLNNKNAIGALYWLDGRYQLILLKERLNKFHIIVPKDLSYNVISKSDLGF